MHQVFGGGVEHLAEVIRIIIYGEIREGEMMMLRKMISILTLLVMLSANVNGMAEKNRYEKVFEAKYIRDVREPIEGHSFFIAEDSEGHHGAVDDTGKIRIPFKFQDLSYVGNGYFSTTGKNSLNGKALMDSAGILVTGFEYGAFEVLGKNWGMGIKIKETAGEPYDYTGFWNDNKYIITETDFIDLKSRNCVGTLRREQYKVGKIVGGDYLLIEDRNGSIQLYDNKMKPVNSTFKSRSDEELEVKRELGTYLVSRITGETVAEGIVASYEINRTDFFAVRGSKTGSKRGIMDRTGKMLSSFDYDDIDLVSSDGSCVVVSQNEKKGLFSLIDAKLVVPCKYDAILKNSMGYIQNGYIAVEVDGKIGYVNLTGKITCEPQYAKNAVKIIGCTMYANEIDGGVVVISADGTITRGIKEIDSYNCSTDGYFLSVKGDNDEWGILDWHGNVVIPCNNESSYIIYGNNSIVSNNSIYRLIR